MVIGSRGITKYSIKLSRFTSWFVDLVRSLLAPSSYRLSLSKSSGKARINQVNQPQGGISQSPAKQIERSALLRICLSVDDFLLQLITGCLPTTHLTTDFPRHFPGSSPRGCCQMAGEWRSIPAHSGLPKIKLLLTSDPGGNRWCFVIWSHVGAMAIPVSWFSRFFSGEPRTFKSFSTTR